MFSNISIVFCLSTVDYLIKEFDWMRPPTPGRWSRLASPYPLGKLVYHVLTLRGVSTWK